MHKKLLMLIPILLLTGCVTQKYGWYGYDDALYAYYKHPVNKERYVERLRLIIEKAEEAHSKVPPGIYAEYGYSFYEIQNYAQAIVYFQKEQSIWPESNFFMDKMIRDAKAMINKAQPKGT